MKPKITRQAPGRWQVVRPAFGFTTTPNTSVYPTWRHAMGSVDRSAGVVPLHNERADQRHDAVSAIPAWTPTWPFASGARTR